MASLCAETDDPQMTQMERRLKAVLYPRYGTSPSHVSLWTTSNGFEPMSIADREASNVTFGASGRRGHIASQLRTFMRCERSY